VTDRGGTSHPARGLSDGTLRFLALAVIELDPEAKGLLCLEEPENGIHPERIPGMLQLLEDIAVDTSSELSPDNPLRQVIINTHSPAVVAQVPEDSLLVAELKEEVRSEKSDSARRASAVSLKLGEPRCPAAQASFHEASSSPISTRSSRRNLKGRQTYRWGTVANRGTPRRESGGWLIVMT